MLTLGIHEICTASNLERLFPSELEQQFMDDSLRMHESSQVIISIHLYPPFTCLDENIKNTEVWSITIDNQQSNQNCHRLDNGWCQVNGCNNLYPPFTCLDENIKNMEVWKTGNWHLDRSTDNSYARATLWKFDTLWAAAPLPLLSSACWPFPAVVDCP